MAAGKYNFTLQQGSTWDQYINLKDGNGAYVDLQVYTASMQIKTEPGGSKFADVSCSIQQTSGSSQYATIRLQLTSTDTSNLSFDRAHYDIEIASGSLSDPQYPQYVERVLQGKIKLSKEITT
tara:strand:+ start:566 stop:934 length:369 start_codon:yes stop_codon:yes gene_type:complete